MKRADIGDYKLPIFNKGDQCWALISSTAYPNLLLIVRCTIKDYEHREVNPLYQIKIDKFYASWKILKRFLPNSRFRRRLNNRTYKWQPNVNDFDSKAEFHEELRNDSDGDYYIWVEGLMICNKLVEARKRLNEIQDAAIEMRLRELEMHITSPEYHGMFSLSTVQEYWDWVYDKFPRFEKFDKDSITDLVDEA